MAKTMKKTQYATPFGVFKYCHLNKPDTRYKKEGEFSVNVAFDKDDPKLIAFMEQIEAVIPALEETANEEFESAGPKAKAKWKQKKITEPTIMPFYEDEIDAEGDPTGRVIFKFKTKATFEDKTGKTIQKVVKLVDSKGEVIPLKKRPLVYAGTIGRVAFTVGTSFIAEEAKAYLSFYLNEVQLRKLVTAGAGGGSSAFEVDEEGEVDGDELDEYEGSTGGADDLNDDQDTSAGSDDLDDEIQF
jgi:hypothetical protein